MRSARSFAVLPATAAAVTGLVAGTLLLPLVLAALGREDGMMPPVAFVTAAVLCWGLVPRLCIEVLSAPRGGAGGAGGVGPGAEGRENPLAVPVQNADNPRR